MSFPVFVCRPRRRRSLTIYIFSSLLFFAVCSIGVSIIFYRSFRELQTEHVFRQHDALTSSIDKSFASFISEAENICQPSGTDTDLQRYLLNIPGDKSDAQLYQLAQKSLDYTALRAKALAGGEVFFYSNTGRYLVSDENYTDYFKTVISRSNLDTNAKITWSFITMVLDPVTQHRYMVLVYPYRSIISRPDEKDLLPNEFLYGMVLIDPARLIENIPIPYDSASIALVSNQHVLASSRQLTPAEITMTKELLQGHSSYTTDDHITYLTDKTRISVYGYSLIYMVPQATIENELRPIRNLYMRVLPVLLLLLALITYLVLLGVRHNLNRLLTGIKNIQTSNARLQDNPVHEFSLITQSINLMLDTIDRVQAEKQEAEQALLQAEIDRQNAQMMAYRSQINPHFLFNALETMRSMAQYVEEVPLTKMITSLSSMLRHVLYTDSFTVLSKEAASLANYIEIIQIRFSGKYRFRMDLAPDTLRCRCLCMMLQPFAENSIKYAFIGYQKKAAPTIYVRSRLDRERNLLIVDLIDNGKGIPENHLREILDNYHDPRPAASQSAADVSIGLANIYQRLKLAYGKHCHMRIISRDGFYTKVTIEIPQQ